MSFNIRFYPVYLILTRLDFWMPVFMLYFVRRFGLGKALELEAIYYAAVVLLEVPSGYFSDRFGRKLTLIVASVAGAFSGMIFATCDAYGAFVLAQLLYAVFMAFNSGSDTSLLYDSLKAEGREDEMLDIEAESHSRAFLFGALGSIVGGVAAYFGDYRAAYALSAIAFAAAALFSVRFTEPPATGPAVETTFVSQLGDCVRALRGRALLWLFAYYMIRTVFEHIPYEFFQPYLVWVVPTAWLGVVSGAHLALTRLVSSWFARRAASLARQWGSATVLVFTNAVVTGLILFMGVLVHPLVVVFLLLRNVAHGLGETVLNAAVHPRIESRMRATYLSMQSLAGRLAFSGTLAGIAAFVGDFSDADPNLLSRILTPAGLVSLAFVAGLAWTRPAEIDNPGKGR